jgi:hypothetical protein
MAIRVPPPKNQNQSDIPLEPIDFFSLLDIRKLSLPEIWKTIAEVFGFHGEFRFFALALDLLKARTA